MADLLPVIIAGIGAALGIAVLYVLLISDPTE